jgi:hypothetical protein
MTITHPGKWKLLQALKKLGLLSFLFLCLTYALPLSAQDNPLGQTFQINTRLQSFVGKPAWTLIVKDVVTGQVMPYFFPIYESEQFWVNFTFTNAYRIIVSELQFGPPDAIIRNFCHLQDGILDRQSLIITLSGRLTPDRRTSDCHVQRFKQYSFPIVTQQPQAQNSSTGEGAASGPEALLSAIPAAASSASSAEGSPSLAALTNLLK